MSFPKEVITSNPDEVTIDSAVVDGRELFSDEADDPEMEFQIRRLLNSPPPAHIEDSSQTIKAIAAVGRLQRSYSKRLF